MIKQCHDLNYQCQDLPAADFSEYELTNINFSGANLAGADFSRTLCRSCDFSGANLTATNFTSADLRGCQLNQADLSGANMYCSILEQADLTEVITDDQTQFFHLYCPEQGAFLGYKKCFGFRIVQLLIPADAQRTSATNNACRCDKAKVLTIKDMTTYQDYNEAVSYVDDQFVYQTGQWAYAQNFNPDRWADSTGGIHFFLTREEAIGYL